MMKYSKLIALACGVLTLTSYTPPPSANGEMDAFIDDLMAKMTLTEKVGQLNLLAVPSFVSGNASDDNDSREQLIVDGKLGSTETGSREESPGHSTDVRLRCYSWFANGAAYTASYVHLMESGTDRAGSPRCFP